MEVISAAVDFSEGFHIIVYPMSTGGVHHIMEEMYIVFTFSIAGLELQQDSLATFLAI
jgi:hypothetical protein